MLKGFEGYYPPDFEKLWKEAVFVFDTNVLLDLYRYSPNSRKELLDILEGLQGRIWIPHQFFFEYHKHKVTIYDDIDNEYKTWEKRLQDYRTSAIEGLQNALGNIKNRTGFELDPRDEEIASIFEEILRDLAESKEQHQSSLNDKALEKQIAQLFAERYGDPFEDSCMANIRQLAEERLEKGIPPGSSKDSKKDESDPDGDLIGWLQTIKYANDEKKPIILVSNDGDWFLRPKGKTKGPYPELLQEMYDKAQVSCYIYKSSQFIKYAKDYLDAQVSDDTIVEAQNREKYIAEQELEKDTVSKLRRTLDAQANPNPELRRRIDALVNPNPELLRITGALPEANPELLRITGSLPEANPELLRITGALPEANPELLRKTGALLEPNPELQRRHDAMMESIAEENQRRIDAMFKPDLEEQQRRHNAMMESIAEENQRRIDAMMKPYFEEQQRRHDAIMESIAEENQRRIDAMMKPYFEEQQRRHDAIMESIAEENQRRIDATFKPDLGE